MIHCGIAKSHPDRRADNAERLRVFLANPFPILPFTTDDAVIAASLRADLESLGKPIGGYDLLIAAQAIANRLTLITANESEFSRVSGLRWKNWAR
jgi:tRNA(fMet)-specific endonuclease VapC